MDELKNEIKRLSHGLRRTAGAGKLYEQNKMNVSRRELNMMIAGARKWHNQDYYQTQWRNPGVMWGLDGMEVRSGNIGKQLHLCNTQDLCSKYKYPPLTSSRHLCGEGIATHLAQLFCEFGARTMGAISIILLSMRF